MRRWATALVGIVAYCGSAHSEEPGNSFADARDLIQAATAAVIEFHCDGYRMSKPMKKIYDELSALGSDGPNWKAWLSITDDIEDQYGLHLNEKTGCKRALADWGPHSGDPLVVRDK